MRIGLQISSFAWPNGSAAIPTALTRLTRVASGRASLGFGAEEAAPTAPVWDEGSPYGIT